MLGADPEVHTPWLGRYDVRTTFHEPFVLFGFLAGFTKLTEFGRITEGEGWIRRELRNVE